MNKGKVSIIVPCYKQAEFLSETLDSVLAQFYSNWECIIVNDGSPDNTEEIAKSYLTKDSRIKYLSKKNEGIAIARNTGISHSNGEYILPLDADDLIVPHYIEKAMERFISHPETKLVYCKARKFGVVNEPWDLEEFDYNQFIWSNCIFNSAIFRRADFDKTDGYNPNMISGLEDWDFWLSFLKRDDIVYRLDDVMFYYRIKDKSRSTELSMHFNDKMLIQICNNHPDIYDQYKEQIVLYQNRIRDLEEINQALEKALSSRAYKLGKTLLKPFSLITKLFKA